MTTPSKAPINLAELERLAKALVYGKVTDAESGMEWQSAAIQFGKIASPDVVLRLVAALRDMKMMGPAASHFLAKHGITDEAREAFTPARAAFETELQVLGESVGDGLAIVTQMHKIRAFYAAALDEIATLTAERDEARFHLEASEKANADLHDMVTAGALSRLDLIRQLDTLRATLATVEAQRDALRTAGSDLIEESLKRPRVETALQWLALENAVNAALTPTPAVKDEAAKTLPTGDEPGFEGQHRMAAFLALETLHRAGITVQDERAVPYLAQFIANWERRGGTPTPAVPVMTTPSKAREAFEFGELLGRFEKLCRLGEQREDERVGLINAFVDATRERDEARGWKCTARTANVGANDPQDCDYPFCGCSPEATRALESAVESGALMPREAATLTAERDEARATSKRLNKRCQEAESKAVKLERQIANTPVTKLRQNAPLIAELATLRATLATVEGENKRLRDALARTAITYHVNVELGNYFECRLCQGKSRHGAMFLGADVSHDQDCALNPTPAVPAVEKFPYWERGVVTRWRTEADTIMGAHALSPDLASTSLRVRAACDDYLAAVPAPEGS